MKIIDPKLCVKCKGRLWCGLSKCPILQKNFLIIKYKKEVDKKEFEGNIFNFFVSRYNYPNVSISLFSSPRIDLVNHPIYWKALNYTIEEILKERVLTISAKGYNFREEEIFEITASKNNLYSYVSLKKKPEVTISFYSDYYPIGPKSKIKSFEVLDYPKVFPEIEKVYYDFDLKAKDAIIYLYNKRIDYYKLFLVLSLGLIGNIKSRKLVPTRWAITAIDKIVGEFLRLDIESYKEIDGYYLGYSNYLGNIFIVILIPYSTFLYELFEMHYPKTQWNPLDKLVYLRDFESVTRRNIDKPNTAGSFYAIRISILEYLKDIKRKAAALVFRIITKDYYAPLGVWVLREGIKDSFKNLEKYSSLEELILNLERKYNFLKPLLKESYILKIMKSSLLKFIT